MNFETGEFFRNEEKLNLSYIEQFLLEIFVRNANRILSREQIISMFESISKKESLITLFLFIFHA